MEAIVVYTYAIETRCMKLKPRWLMCIVSMKDKISDVQNKPLSSKRYAWTRHVRFLLKNNIVRNIW